MPTDSSLEIALFLFAHQDDEFGVFAALEQERAIGRQIVCVYVTDGGAADVSARRTQESVAVLDSLGIARTQLHFLGQSLHIEDGKLFAHVSPFAAWLNAFLDANARVRTCYVPAWEGGHPDHDLIHAIAVRAWHRRQRPLTELSQYSLYHGEGCPWLFFKVMSPIAANGPIKKLSFSARAAVRYLGLCCNYPSQWKTWIGLLPFAALQLLVRRAQCLQPVSVARLFTPPHPLPLYYEKRGFYTWQKMHQIVEQI
jgi:LmbE family N-acetylglucosaminyl deacetylase